MNLRTTAEKSVHMIFTGDIIGFDGFLAIKNSILTYSTVSPTGVTSLRHLLPNDQSGRRRRNPGPLSLWTMTRVERDFFSIPLSMPFFFVSSPLFYLLF